MNSDSGAMKEEAWKSFMTCHLQPTISNYIGMAIKIKSLTNLERCHCNDTTNCQLTSLRCLYSSIHYLHSLPSIIHTQTKSNALVIVMLRVKDPPGLTKPSEVDKFVP